MRFFVLKPDGIGDFILATGALRTLAKAAGEENLAICVRSVLVPLARSEFPRATVLEMPVAAKRRVLNLFVRNFLACLPLWRQLRRTPNDVAICLRSMRNYLETFLFISARAPRHVACENGLLTATRPTRRHVEHFVSRAARAELVSYPTPPADVPLEIEAHRRVVARVLDRPVALDEIMPRLSATQPEADHWVCAPVSKLAAKDFPFARWVELFVALKPLSEKQNILLAGAREDAKRLEVLDGLLRESGFCNCRIVLPSSLVDYVNLIAGAAMVLTVDTAAAHIATALDRRTIVFFSGLHRGMFAPWTRSHRQHWLTPAPGTKRKKWHAGIPTSTAAEGVRQLCAESDIAKPDPPAATP